MTGRSMCFLSQIIKPTNNPLVSVDISKLGLQDLRSKLSIIPQEVGNLRSVEAASALISPCASQSLSYSLVCNLGAHEHVFVYVAVVRNNPHQLRSILAIRRRTSLRCITTRLLS